MTLVLASIAGFAVYLIVVPSKGGAMAAYIEPYLIERGDEGGGRRGPVTISFGGPASAFIGASIGFLVAQGDLFIAGSSRSSFALGLLGSLAGWMLWSIRQTNLRERRARRLQFELPVVADALSLHVVAGESISASIHSVVDEISGVAAGELRAVVGALREGEGMIDALSEASRSTSHPDATRLYETLSHAHDTGGRLAVALGDLAADYRSALERDLTSESGRRSIATYGPVLTLMVPTALIFLIYPTIVGLQSLTGTP